MFAIVEGDRPRAGSSVVARPAVPARNPGDAAAPSGGKFPWSKVIDASVIEDEVKAIKLAVDKDVTTPGEFKGRGYKLCRRNLTVAAMLFAIIHEFDGEVRWKKGASGLRDVLARTAKNCKVGTTQVYNEAKQRKLDLQDVVGGNDYAGQAGDPDKTWEQICDRSPLMQRLETALLERLKPHTSSQDEFRKNKEQVIHEAQIIAAIAEVLMKDSMEDAGEEIYDGFSQAMKKAGRDIVDGAAADNYEQVREAVGRIDQSCSDCHENFRA